MHQICMKNADITIIGKPIGRVFNQVFSTNNLCQYLDPFYFQNGVPKSWNSSFFHFLKNSHQGCFAKKRQKVSLFLTFFVFLLFQVFKIHTSSEKTSFQKNKKLCLRRTADTKINKNAKNMWFQSKTTSEKTSLLFFLIFLVFKKSEKNYFLEIDSFGVKHKK